MNSTVDLPAHPVYLAAKAVCDKLSQAYEMRKTMAIEDEMAFEHSFLWVFKWHVTKEQAQKTVADPHYDLELWNGTYAQFGRSFKLLTLTAAALQNDDDWNVQVSAQDLAAIQGVYFDEGFRKTARIIAAKAARANFDL
jgi:hypothetical protein